MTAETTPYDAMFSGIIGQEYEMLKRLSPLAIEMSRRVGESVSAYPVNTSEPLSVVEIGSGTGITTLALLTAKEAVCILSIDNEPTMQNQAKQNLQKWLEEGKLAFCADDALTALTSLPAESLDIVASAYTLHNFSDSYRQDVIAEIFRVLKPGGQFINGDRYGLDDISKHTRLIQEEVGRYFSVLIQANKLDLLEQWVVHLFNDESENHVMREAASIRHLQAAGFAEIQLSHRLEVNALLTAKKPI